MDMGRETNWRLGLIYTLPCVRQTELEGAAVEQDSAWCYEEAPLEGGSREEEGICMHMAGSLRCTAETEHNTVEQFYSN